MEQFMLLVVSRQEAKSMFPIGDDNTGERSVPVVTFALIALNVLFFFLELSGGDAFVKENAGGVAYMAHIGGFVAGCALTLMLGGKRRALTA